MVEHGIHQRFAGEPPKQIRQQIEYEMQLISELNYEHYFLTIQDMVQLRTSAGAFCVRGGDPRPIRHRLLLLGRITAGGSGLSRESAIREICKSKERNEAPDIDVDFEHERREEVHAVSLSKVTAETARDWRPKVISLSVPFAQSVMWERPWGMDPCHLSWMRWPIASPWKDIRHEPGNSPNGCQQVRNRSALGTAASAAWSSWSTELIGFPPPSVTACGWHGDHTLVHCRELVPIENAAMAERTVIQLG